MQIYIYLQEFLHYFALFFFRGYMYAEMPKVESFIRARIKKTRLCNLKKRSPVTFHNKM